VLNRLQVPLREEFLPSTTRGAGAFFAVMQLVLRRVPFQAGERRAVSRVAAEA